MEPWAHRSTDEELLPKRKVASGPEAQVPARACTGKPDDGAAAGRRGRQPGRSAYRSEVQRRPSMRARAVRTDQPTTPTRPGARSARFGCGEAASSRPGPRHRPAVAGGIGLVAPSAALHQKISSLNTTLGVGRTPPDAPHRCRSAPCGPRTCSTSCTVARLASLGACLGVMGGKFRGLGLRCCSADRRMGVGPVGWPSRRSMRPVAGACGAHPRNPTSEERSSKDTGETAGSKPRSGVHVAPHAYTLGRGVSGTG